MPEQQPENPLKSWVSWIKFLLPLAIGGIGLYVGQIIAPMDSRMKSLESKSEKYTQHVHTDEAVMIEFNRRLVDLEKEIDEHRTSDHSSFATKEQVDLLRSRTREDIKDLRENFRSLDPTIRYNNSSRDPRK